MRRSTWRVANPYPSTAPVSTHIPGLMIEDEIQKAMVAERGMPARSSTAMSAIPERERNGDHAPKNAAARIIRTARPRNTLVTRMSALLACPHGVIPHCPCPHAGFAPGCAAKLRASEPSLFARMSVAHRTNANASAAFELKSAALTLISVVVKTADLALLAAELGARLADTPGLFENDPVVIDVSPLRATSPEIDFTALAALLRQHRMQPVAVKGASPAQTVAALAAGLSEAPEGVQPTVRTPAPADAPPEVPADEPPPQPASAPITAAKGVMPTVVIDRPLRSGQQVYARGADLVVMAAVSFGAEVIADGHIHIYAPLRGRAIAGASGNTNARIFTTCMEPQLVSIAGIYRTSENDLPDSVKGKPAQVRLDGERLLIEPIAV